MKEENNELRDWFLNEISKIDITGDKQNQDTKWLDKWQKLKEWIKEREKKHTLMLKASAFEDIEILNKMQELEGEDE